MIPITALPPLNDGSSLRHHICALAVLWGLVATCMLVRARVQDEMFLGQAIPIIPGLFSLRYVRNPGAAFSFLATAPEELRVPFFIGVTLLALAALTIMYLQDGHESWLTRISLASVAGGAMSNLVERLLAGDVVDYLDVYVGPYHWPTFNLADTAISVGVGLILLEILWSQRGTRQTADGRGETDAEQVSTR
jgi:signal peptidase II